MNNDKTELKELILPNIEEKPKRLGFECCSCGEVFPIKRDRDEHERVCLANQDNGQN